MVMSDVLPQQRNWLVELRAVQSSRDLRVSLHLEGISSDDGAEGVYGCIFGPLDTSLQHVCVPFFMKPFKEGAFDDRYSLYQTDISSEVEESGTSDSYDQEDDETSDGSPSYNSEGSENLITMQSDILAPITQQNEENIGTVGDAASTNSLQDPMEHWFLCAPCLYVLCDIDCQHLMQVDDGRLVIDHLWDAETKLTDLFSDLQNILLTPSDHGLLGLRRMISSCLNAVCETTGHKGSDPQQWVPQPKDVRHLGIPELPDLSEQEHLNKLLSSETIETIDGVVTQEERKQFREETLCYVLQESLATVDADSIFGFGLTVDYFANGCVRGITSPCEYISWDAFQNGLRHGMYRQPIMAFLPLYLTHEHAERSRSIIHFMLNRLSLPFFPCPNPGLNFFTPKPAKLRTLASLLNSMVVSAMQSVVNGADLESRQHDILLQPLSLKLLEGLHQIMRVVKFILDDDPCLQRELDETVQAFASASPEMRTKLHFRNLGELLALVPFSKYHWRDIIEAYIQESMVRSVRWYLDSYPQLQEESLAPEERILLTFLATRVSRMLTCFQAFFIRNVAQRASFKDVLFSCDARLGRLPPRLAEDMMEMVNEINTHESWNDYFKFIEHPTMSQEDLFEQLIFSLRRSKELNYHN